MDAENALGLFLRALEWFYCECQQGPRLPTISNVQQQRSITLQQMMEDLIQRRDAEDRRRRELPKESIVGLRFADVSDVFKNRVDETTQLRRLLGDRTVKLICIVGRGGIGKTALLSKVCAEIERGELRLSEAAAGIGAEGIIYVSCRGTDKLTVERLFHDVGRALGSPHAEALLDCWRDSSRSLADKARFLLSQLRDGCYLLVLDNLEDALAPDNTIADADLRVFVDLCLGTPHALRLIATSRERVEVNAQVLRARRFIFLGQLDDANAIALLRDSDPDGELGLRDAPDELLQDTARRCYGIPFALQKISGILSSIDAPTLEKLLGDTALFNEKVVENLIDYQYSRVTDDQCRVLEALAVYNEPVPIAAVRYLLLPFFPNVDVDGCLRTLARNYFVTYQRGRDTYELHPLDQQHAYAHIPDEGDYCKRALHRRAAEFYRQLRKPQEEWKTIDDLDPQLQEFHHLVCAGLYDRACALLNDIDFNYMALWGYSGLIVELRSYLIDRLTDRYCAHTNWTLLGYAYNRLWLPEDAIRCLKRGLQISEAAHDQWMVGDLKGNLGRALMVVGQITDALCMFQEAVETMHKYGTPIYEALWTGHLGEAWQRLGKMEEALDCYRFALNVSRTGGDWRWQVVHLSNIGEERK